MQGCPEVCPDQTLRLPPISEIRVQWHTYATMHSTPLTPWMQISLPPERFAPLEVRLPDDAVQSAIWTGAKWWSQGHEVKPQAWRPLESELLVFQN